MITSAAKTQNKKKGKSNMDWLKIRIRTYNFALIVMALITVYSVITQEVSGQGRILLMLAAGVGGCAAIAFSILKHMGKKYIAVLVSDCGMMAQTLCLAFCGQVNTTRVSTVIFVFAASMALANLLIDWKEQKDTLEAAA